MAAIEIFPPKLTLDNIVWDTMKKQYLLKTLMKPTNVTISL
jgi:hypothetical protein